MTIFLLYDNIMNTNNVTQHFHNKLLNSAGEMKV